jgi:hypothetical protein
VNITTAVAVVGLLIGDPAAAIGSETIREVRFTGGAAIDEVCACLLDARRTAESQGRINFSADVAISDSDERTDVTARIWMGSAHAVGRINFIGHDRMNDSTLRRALTLHERDLFDVTKLRRSLDRINRLGVFEPLSVSDIEVARRDDGVTADVTIPLRERKRRWWSLSLSPIPGFGSLQASISSRLPSWGRGALEASTYFVTFNLIGFVPALVRPVIPGQEWLSGFAISPAMSPRAMAAQYGRTHLARGVSAVLDEEPREPLIVPVTSGATSADQVLVCRPPKARLWWLRRGAGIAVNVALASAGLSH